jgi:YD repeat-containing protein
MNTPARLLLCALLGAPPVPARAADAQAEILETYKGSLAEFLGGRYKAAEAGYQYLVTLGSMDPTPTASLALMLREQGKPDAAAAQWLKSTLLGKEDAFYWNQRAWNYLALGRFREAKDAFRKALEHADRPDDAGEAHLGLGLAESMDGNDKAALPEFEDAMKKSTYLRPAASLELARLRVRRRDYGASIQHFTESLEADRQQPETARELARVYEKTGQAKAAWQANKLVLDLDPRDRHAKKRLGKLERYIEGRPSDSLPLVRLARPMFRGIEYGSEDDRMPPSLRIAMFAGPDGRPRHLTRFYVMGSTTTRLWDLRLEDEVVQAAPPYRQWEVSYRADSRLIEIRDTNGNIVYVTKQPFRFQPAREGFTVLVKNPQPTDVRGIDLSDREMRGMVEVIPTPEGFHLVNEVPLQEYLFGITPSALPPGSPPGAYKTLSVLTRSKVLQRVRRRRTNAERTHLCDSEHCFVYRGLAKERADSTEAVRDTGGVTIRPPKGEGFEEHRSCGWSTASGVQDRRTPALVIRTPVDLERLTHRFPDKKLYHESSAIVPENWNRWIRILDPKPIRERIERVTDVGPLKRVIVLSRDQTGRVTAVKIVGARGEAEFKGAKAVEAVLSPGGLRSTLFTLTPLYRGKRLRKLIVWGAGTGHGRGVCLAGVLGQAHLGRRFDQILDHYYGSELEYQGYTRPPKPVVLEPVRATKPKKAQTWKKPRTKSHRRRPRRRRPLEKR